MRKAFTLMELLVVVTVLPFLLVVVSGVYFANDWTGARGRQRK